MQKIVVTGATSMLGIALIKKAITHGVTVLALVRKHSQRKNRIPSDKLITVVEYGGDSCINILEKPDYEVFYHFAWSHTDKAGRNDCRLQAENIGNTLDAVKLAKQLGCTKFIGAGSQAEYGPVEGIISESTPCHPETAYGIAKYAAGRMAENLCAELGMNYVWGRIFSVYGINDNEGTMINYAVDQFIKGMPANFSAATQMWNYLNEKDAGEIFFALGGEAKGVFCVAHPRSAPLREYIEVLCSSFGKEAKAVFAAKNTERKVYGLEANTNKLVNTLDYTPQVAFQQGISEVIAYRKSVNI